MPAQLDILVVDDNPEVLLMIREILALQRHHVRTFSGGETAIADFKRQAADLVITDLGMPEVTGWQIARSIRALSPETPIVFITAVGEQVDDDLLRELGIAAVLHKPFKIAEISQILQALD